MKETCVMKCIMTGQQIQASQRQSNNSRDFSLSTFPLGFWFFWWLSWSSVASLASFFFSVVCYFPVVCLVPCYRQSVDSHGFYIAVTCAGTFGINRTWWGRQHDFTIEEILWLAFTTVLLTFLNCCLNSSYSVDSMLLLLYLYKCLILIRTLSLCSILCS